MSWVRERLLRISDVLEFSAKKIRGTARRLSTREATNLADIQNSIRPCFVLSTGRCGTLLLNRLLLLSPNAFAMHTPHPELISSSKRAYESIAEKPEVFTETFIASREELLLQAAEGEKVYIETNNRITFFAPVIKDILPSSLFIHLVRHPGDFVRSGVRRGWYSGEHPHDVGRIVPLSGDAKKSWDRYDVIEKIGWLWNETNRFIENFKKELGDNRVLFMRGEDLFTETAATKRIYDFVGLIAFNESKVRKMLTRPANQQKKNDYPEFCDWPNDQRRKLSSVTPLASAYGYDLS